MALTIGTVVGSYVILSAIGAGGMGEVYKSRDTRLDRVVAVEVLPDSVSADPDRVARFEREARTLATLNHTHIAQIYGVEELRGGRSPVSGGFGARTLTWVDRQGGEEPVGAPPRPYASRRLQVSPDGSRLVTDIDDCENNDIPPKSLFQTPFIERNAALSQDGRWLAYDFE